MKKILIVLLCIAMLLPCFAGCTEQGEHICGVDISDYSIIISETAGKHVKQQAQALVALVMEHTGVRLPVKTDVEAAPSDKEFVIGQTNRSESADVLTAAGSKGFAVKFDGKKLIINGTSDYIIGDGVQWFVKNYVFTKSGNKGIDMDTSLNVTKSYTSVKLVENGKSNFSVVYSQHMDDNNGDPSFHEDGYTNGGLDYEVQLAYNIKVKLEELTGATVTLKTDAEPTSGPEILVGRTNRDADEKLLANMGFTQYGVGYVDSSIVIAGYSTAANAMACKQFMDMLPSKSSSITLDLGEASLRANTSWVSNFPKYDGGIVRGTAESVNDELQYYITNTTDAHFRAYCDKLEYYGYTLHMSNDMGDKVLSRTYMNEDTVIHTYYSFVENTTRIFVGSVGKVQHPVPTTGEYTKIADFQITQMQLDFGTNSGGMGYIITLEDGSFLLIDSGSTTRKGASQNYDHVRLWNLLNKLNKREDGKIIIRGWFITHSHSDHYDVYQQFLQTYGKKVTIDNHYECVVSDSARYNSKNPGAKTNKCVTLHAGMKMHFYGIDVEIMTTYEDIYPRTVRYFNDTSTVFRVSANGTSFMVTGDICDQASDIVSRRYGEYLKSDIVQAAHHANIGSTIEFYDYVSPSVVLWPTSSALLTPLVTGKGNQRYYAVDYHLYKEMGIKEHYTNGEYTVTLTIPETGYKASSAERYQVSTKDQYK